MFYLVLIKLIQKVLAQLQLRQDTKKIITEKLKLKINQILIKTNQLRILLKMNKILEGHPNQEKALNRQTKVHMELEINFHTKVNNQDN
jgi:hypothetical protein